MNRSARSRSRPDRLYRPFLELVERRELLAVFSVTSIADAGSGSLRAAIQAANANAGADEIHFEIPGDGPHRITLDSALPTITDTLTINGYTQPGASPNTQFIGSNANLRIILDGSKPLTGIDGLNFETDGNVVRGLTIGGFQGTAIRFGAQSSGNLVQGNFIGVTVDGQSSFLNFQGVHRPNLVGVQALGSQNTIGGTAPADRNLISGSVGGRFIGVLLGDQTFPTGPGQNLILGNDFGVNAEGTKALFPGSNGGPAIGIHNDGNTIGGTALAARNVIAGHNRGIQIRSSENLIQGNNIGTDREGQILLGNSVAGIEIDSTSMIQTPMNNTIGGTAPGAGNVIAGSGNAGIRIAPRPSDVITGTVIQGNFIGTDRAGVLNLGNARAISIADSTDSQIGGLEPGAGNLIAHTEQFSLASAIQVTGNISTGNRILSNRFIDIPGIPIDLGADGPTLNDDGDADEGPNQFQNYPVIDFAQADTGGTVIRGNLRSRPNTEFTVQIFAGSVNDVVVPGDIQEVLQTLIISTDGGGQAPFEVVLPRSLANTLPLYATATDPDGNTSEISPGFLVEGLDVTPLTVLQVGPVVPSPRRDPLTSVDVVFSSEINASTFNVDDLRLTFNSNLMPLNHLVQVEQVEGATYRVSNLNPFTTKSGRYVLTVDASGIFNLAGNPGEGTGSTSFEVRVQAPTESGKYEGDRRTNLGVFGFDSAKGFARFQIARRSAPDLDQPFGGPFDLPLSGDYDGDGITDIGTFGFSPDEGFARFAIISSSTDQALSIPFGGPFDLPVAGDYDGDGITDLAVFGFSPDDGFARFAIVFSSTGQALSIPFGGPFDLPVAGDYDGDGKTDLVVFGFSPDEGFARFAIVYSSTDQALSIPFGGPFDLPVCGDFDGDGKTDLVVYGFSPDEGFARFAIISSSTDQAASLPFGGPFDVPLAGDYDGDGKTDLAVYGFSPDEGFARFAIALSGDNTTIVEPIGQEGDLPLPSSAAVVDRVRGGSRRQTLFEPSRASSILDTSGIQNVTRSTVPGRISDSGSQGRNASICKSMIMQIYDESIDNMVEHWWNF